MIRSMTGYGKAEATFENKKYIAEIRSLNGKNCDLSVKTQIIPREHELSVRQYIARELVRGNIDLYITSEQIEGVEPREIDKALFAKYYAAIVEASESVGLCIENQHDIVSTILRMPDVVSAHKEDMSAECWDAIYRAIVKAVEQLKDFRETEGVVLRKDLEERVDNILKHLQEVERYESLRIESIKDRISSKMNELEVIQDQSRFEQEMIFYIEKLDVNEEKVRLRQHCSYFLETMGNEDFPGKKLGFIAQEMGREINTLGSKSNQVDMQRCVVMMKDELEKIKEQVLNIL